MRWSWWHRGRVGLGFFFFLRGGQLGEPSGGSSAGLLGNVENELLNKGSSSCPWVEGDRGRPYGVAKCRILLKTSVENKC